MEILYIIFILYILNKITERVVYIIPICILFFMNTIFHGIYYTNDSVNYNIYDIIQNQIASYWSQIEHYFLLFIICLFIYFLKSNSIKLVYHNLQYYIVELTLVICLFYTTKLKIGSSYYYLSTHFNSILNHPLVSIHPPIILISTLIVKVLIIFVYYELLTKTLSENKKVISFLFFLFTISILLGSIWSNNLFGWGGLWSWDPIEIVSIIYWYLLLFILHSRSRKTTFLLLLFMFFYDFYIFIANRLGLLTSIHIFNNNELLNSSHYLYIHIITFFFFYTFLKNLNLNSNLNHFILNFILCFVLFCLNFILIHSKWQSLYIPYQILNIFHIGIILICFFILLKYSHYQILIPLLFLIIFQLYVNILILFLISVTFTHFLNILYSIPMYKYYFYYVLIHLSFLLFITVILNYSISEIHIPYNSYDFLYTQKNLYRLNDIVITTELPIYTINTYFHNTQTYEPVDLLTISESYYNCYYFSNTTAQFTAVKTELTFLLKNTIDSLIRFELQSLHLFNVWNLNKIIILLFVFILLFLNIFFKKNNKIVKIIL